MATLVPTQCQQAWMDPGPISGHPEDRAYVFRPRLGYTGGPAMIWCHGALLNASNGVVPGPIHEFLARLAALGVTTVAPDLGNPASSNGPGSTNPWGCTTATARMEAWRVWMAANLPCDASKVHIGGFSMGGPQGLGYARDYPTKVLSVTGWLPALDVKAINEAVAPDPLNALTPMVAAAYGITAGAPLPAGADPYTDVSLRGLKWRGYYGYLPGTYIPPDWCQRMAAWTGGECFPTQVTSHSMDAVQEPNTPFDEWTSWAGIT